MPPTSSREPSASDQDGFFGVVELKANHRGRILDRWYAPPTALVGDELIEVDEKLACQWLAQRHN